VGRNARAGSIPAWGTKPLTNVRGFFYARPKYREDVLSKAKNGSPDESYFFCYLVAIGIYINYESGKFNEKLFGTS
jgi:hypothetical protein